PPRSALDRDADFGAGRIGSASPARESWRGLRRSGRIRSSLRARRRMSACGHRLFDAGQSGRPRPDACSPQSVPIEGVCVARIAGTALATDRSGPTSQSAMIRAFRHATRTLLRNPGFTLVSALTLSIGLAGATAVYAVLERVVLDPLPYPHVDRLVRLRSQVPGLAPDAEWDLSPGQFFFIARESRTLNAI